MDQAEKIRPSIKNQAVNLQTNKTKVRQRNIILLVVLLLMLSGKIFAQQKKGNDLSAQRAITTSLPLRIIFIQPDHYSKQLGFICKKEWMMEKKTTLPLRLRLGSLDYVNKMEGKKY